jgi:hypothetical protein
MTFRTIKILALAAFAALTMPVAAQAQWWEHHPGYLHAMSDVRMAYWLIAHREGGDPMANHEEKRALKDVRYAYQELKDAAIMDDRNIDDQPPADMSFYDHRGRLHKALDLLRDAHDQVDREEEDPMARGLKHRAAKRIDDAARSIEAAIGAWNF